MKRRETIKFALYGGLAFTATKKQLALASSNENESAGSHQLSSVLRELALLKDSTLTTSGEWNFGQICEHCVQSIEFSIQGFPIHRSDVFKFTVGAVAFSFFSARGAMSHGLSDPIPGASTLEKHSTSPESNLAALIRLQDAIALFENYQGPLAPHFAYGDLTKDQYALAHALHIKNHLEEINAKQA